MSPTGSPSPTSGSPAKPARQVLTAPPWLARLLTPLMARYVAREIYRKHPGFSPQQIRDAMVHEVGELPNDEQSRFIDAVIERVPRQSDAEKPLSAWILVTANAVPLLGVLFWGWDAFALIALFWMENVIVGVFFILRMLCLDPRDAALWAAKVFMVPLFCFHYGLFTAGHGVFVFSLLGGKRYDVQGFELLEPATRAAADFGLYLPLAVLFASHLFSFGWNYLGRGEFRSARLSRLMTEPYKRIIVLHVAIILGGLGAMALGSPLWALVVLLAVKIALDFKAHVKEHSKT
jgi:hypothetical protein